MNPIHAAYTLAKIAAGTALVAIVGGIMLPTAADAVGPSSPGMERLTDWGCGDAAQWWADLSATFDAGLVVTGEVYQDIYASPAELDAADDELTVLLDDLNELSVPRVAAEFHAAHIALIEHVAAIITARQAGDLAAARSLDTAQAMWDINTALDNGYTVGFRRCGQAWYDTFWGAQS